MKACRQPNHHQCSMNKKHFTLSMAIYHAQQYRLLQGFVTYPFVSTQLNSFFLKKLLSFYLNLNSPPG